MSNPIHNQMVAKQALMERSARLKGQVLMASVLAFGLFGGLALSRNATASLPPASQSPSTPSSTASGSADQAPTDPGQAGASDNGFFTQGGNGYGFGASSGSPYATTSAS